jgi:membrane-associated protease RseP (regulator of RpoE activity)
VVAIEPSGLAAQAGITYGARLLVVNGLQCDVTEHALLVSQLASTGPLVIRALPDSGLTDPRDVVANLEAPNVWTVETIGLVLENPTGAPIGCTLTSTDETTGDGAGVRHVVDHVAANTPAAAAGIEAGDELLEIGSKHVVGWPHARVLELLVASKTAVDGRADFVVKRRLPVQFVQVEKTLTRHPGEAWGLFFNQQVRERHCTTNHALGTRNGTGLQPNHASVSTFVRK